MICFRHSGASATCGLNKHSKFGRIKAKDLSHNCRCPENICIMLIHVTIFSLSTNFLKIMICCLFSLDLKKLLSPTHSWTKNSKYLMTKTTDDSHNSRSSKYICITLINAIIFGQKHEFLYNLLFVYKLFSARWGTAAAAQCFQLRLHLLSITWTVSP